MPSFFSDVVNTVTGNCMRIYVAWSENEEQAESDSGVAGGVKEKMSPNGK